MRDRLVAALVGTVVVVVVVMAVVRAYAVAGDVERNAHATVDRSLAMVSIALEERLRGGRPVNPDVLKALAHDDIAITYQPPGGEPVTGGLPVTTADREFSGAEVLPGGGRLTVVRPAEDIGRRISEGLLPLVLLALALMLTAAVVGWLLAQRIARPFQELADAARGLGRGHAGITVPHYGVVEADAIGTALREGLARIDRLQERERRFAVSASHELRSPITALRLQVEGLGLDPRLPEEVRGEVAGVLRGIDRLSAAVGTVLGTAGSERDTRAPAVDPVPLVGEAVRRLPRRARRRVEQRLATDIVIDVPPDPLSDVVAALLEDCITHGRGAVALELTDHSSHIELLVGDAGPRRAEVGVLHPRTAPPGLSRAVELAESFGGRLLVPEGASHRYRLLLPCSEERGRKA